MSSTFIIKSTKHGEQRFEIRSGRGYGYVYLNGQQICNNGKLTGSTVLCYDSSLPTVAKKWWKKFLENERKYS